MWKSWANARVYSKTDQFAWIHGGKVTNQVVSYQRKEVSSGKVIDEQPLDLPAPELYIRCLVYCVLGQFISAG